MQAFFFLIVVMGLSTVTYAQECAIAGREQTQVIATCQASQVLRDQYGWDFRNSSLELVKARYFDCRDGVKVPGKEFFATVETDDRMLALSVEGDLALGRQQKGTWSSEDQYGIYVRQSVKGDRDVFSINFDKKTNRLRYVMRHRKFLRKRPVADVVFDCRLTE